MARTTTKPRIPARDSLSNLAASLNTGKDKAANDAFFVADLPRHQIEAMYRGDWLARKIVDIVPYDSVREWREWAGNRADIAAVEAAERRLNLRRVLQRAMIQGRLYGGGAVVIGTDESDPAALAAPLHPETMRPGSLRFLHVVSRWQLAADAINRDPLDPFFGEPDSYALVGPNRGELRLHPSRVVRFLGNPLPDPMGFGAPVWSDSVLQTLYDAVHAVALTATGATSLVHEAKVDIVTVPNLSEHLANAGTTAQLSARFSYAAAMKSINNLLLLGDGESWARQRIDFAGLPEMVRTFLQIAAGAADIPVTRLLGQSPAGLSATGDSDTRNYYDMISARQELDLRPQLERLDALILRSAGVDPGALSFEFRPLWQLDAREKAQVALQKAQTTAVYAGLNLWPVATTAALVRSQLLEDGTYPNAEAAFSGIESAAVPGQADLTAVERETADFDPSQPRDPDGRWASGRGGAPRSSSGEGVGLAGAGIAKQSHAHASAGSASLLGNLMNALNPIKPASAQEIDPEEENRGLAEESSDPTQPIRTARYYSAMNALRAIDPKDPELVTLTAPNYVPSETDVGRVELAAKVASLKRVRDYVMPGGELIGEPGNKYGIREMSGGLPAAQRAFDHLSAGGTLTLLGTGKNARLPGNAGFITLRPTSSTPGSPAVDINVPGVPIKKLHY